MTKLNKTLINAEIAGHYRATVLDNGDVEYEWNLFDERGELIGFGGFESKPRSK